MSYTVGGGGTCRLPSFDLREGGGGHVHQPDLFDAPRREHDERLDRTLDVVHERFGEGALTRARHLDAGHRSGRCTGRGRPFTIGTVVRSCDRARNAEKASSPVSGISTRTSAPGVEPYAACRP